ncbi:hypothetical protein ACIBLA_25070 [Streptomyces sp. NPDC050433]|uniref:hypothetical protein n=1 Tax=unclassified Streptomyces TaxID=2593676 RepID=UPI00343BBE07
MVERSSNDLSGSVTGHVVQAGAVHGDVVLDAAARARIEHARSLSAERLSTYASFLEVAEALSEQLNTTALLAEEFVRPKIWTHRELYMLRSNLSHDGASLKRLRPFKYAVQMIGPESAYGVACSVSAGLVALHISSEIVSEKEADVPRRWQRNHERFREGLHERLSRFRDEIRKVREAHPA